MAYPTVSGPYGLVPVKLLSGSPFVGVTRHFKIASGYATAIFNGDAVKLVTGGTIERDKFDAAMNKMLMSDEYWIRRSERKRAA